MVHIEGFRLLEEPAGPQHLDYGVRQHVYRRDRYSSPVRERNPVSPVALIILDGFGLAPEGPGNAVMLADTPNFDRYWRDYPHTQVQPRRGWRWGCRRGRSATRKWGT